MPYMTMDNNGELHGLFKRVRKAVSRVAKKVGSQVARTAKQAGSFVKRSTDPERLKEVLAPKRLFSPKLMLARLHKASVTPLFMGRFIEKQGYSNILTNPPAPDVLIRSMTSSRYKKKMMEEAQAKTAAEMSKIKPTYVDSVTGKVIPASEMDKYYKPGEEPVFVDQDGNPIPPDQLHLYQLPGVKSGGVNPAQTIGPAPVPGVSSRWQGEFDLEFYEDLYVAPPVQNRVVSPPKQPAAPVVPPKSPVYEAELETYTLSGLAGRRTMNRKAYGNLPRAGWYIDRVSPVEEMTATQPRSWGTVFDEGGVGQAEEDTLITDILLLAGGIGAIALSQRLNNPDLEAFARLGGLVIATVGGTKLAQRA